MARSKTTWGPGQSGNPTGRTPKERALTAVLETAGSQTVDVNGKRVSGNRIVARLLWEIAATGKATMPDGAVMLVSPRDWLDVVKFIYTQVDGPVKQEVDVTSNGNTIFVEYVNDWRETQ
jgi:hypothetical protein